MVNLKNLKKDQVKQAIWNYEYYNNGFNKLCGTGVKVLNLRINKVEMKAFADIVLITDAEAGISERYNNSEYDLNHIDRWLERSEV